MAGAGKEETMAQVPLDLHTLCCPEPKSSLAAALQCTPQSASRASASPNGCIEEGRRAWRIDRGVNQGRGWWGKGVEDEGGGRAGGARMSGIPRYRICVEKGAG
jgi:hypothetical protein